MREHETFLPSAAQHLSLQVHISQHSPGACPPSSPTVSLPPSVPKLKFMSPHLQLQIRWNPHLLNFRHCPNWLELSTYCFGFREDNMKCVYTENLCLSALLSVCVCALSVRLTPCWTSPTEPSCPWEYRQKYWAFPRPLSHSLHFQARAETLAPHSHLAGHLCERLLKRSQLIALHPPQLPWYWAAGGHL